MTVTVTLHAVGALKKQKTYKGDDLMVSTDKIVSLGPVRSFERTGELYICRRVPVEGKPDQHYEKQIAVFAQGQWMFWEMEE